MRSLAIALAATLTLLAIPANGLCATRGGALAPVGAAVAADPAVSAPAIASLRAAGPAGLDALFAAYDSQIRRMCRDSMPAGAEWERIRAALDAVGAQRDCYASHLYWYTDLDEAKAAARASGKPILSLRLLGRLDEELSCANSRFFRTALYANADVSKYLRAHFILHWKSQRPAPRITIDYGDGRKLVRTITGNSIHYVLDAEGRPVDALPGLYGPAAFLRELAAVEAEAAKLKGLTGAERESALRQYHRAKIESAGREWAAYVERIRDPKTLQMPMTLEPPDRAVTSSLPAIATAGDAERLTATKAIVEIGMLKVLDLESDPARRPFDDAIWSRIAAMSPSDARLDQNGRAMLCRHVPHVADSATDERNVQAVLAAFESSMAIETVRNQYTLRPAIHSWLAESPENTDLEALNAWVYERVFLTPDSDPWLGLYPSSYYTALENGGVETDQ